MKIGRLHQLSSALVGGQCAHVMLVIYGVIIVSILGTWLYLSLPVKIDNQIIMGFRLTELRFAIDSWNAGYPLLTGLDSANYIDKYSSLDQARQHGMRAIGISDDLGMYMIVPPLASWFGLDDPGVILKYIIFFSFFALMCFYPLIFNRLSPSHFLVLLSPFLVIPGMAFGYISGFSAVYWVQAWVLLACTPLLWLALKKPWNRRMLHVLLVVAFIAGIASVFRSAAGLGVLGACLIVLLIKSGFSGKGLVYVTVLVLVYLVSSQGVISLATSYRNANLMQAGITDIRPANHPFWHTIYIGLGWQDRPMRMLEKFGPMVQEQFARLGFGKPNPWGIKYKDEFAAAKVAESDPEAVYLSKAYSDVLRQEYFRLLRQDPWYFFQSYLLKFVTSLGVSIWMVFSFSMMTISLGVLAISLGIFRDSLSMWRALRSRLKESIHYFLIIAPIAGIGVLQGLLASPNSKYLLGLTGSLYLVWMLLIIFLFQSMCERLLSTPSKLRETG